MSLIAPKALRPTLLQALNECGGAQAPVKSSAVVTRMAEILTQQGLVLSAEDRKTLSTNASWLATQVLRKEGVLGASDARGWWSLASTPAPVTITAHSPIPEAPAAHVVEVRDTTGAVVGYIGALDTYVKDPFLKSLAMSQTKCFGAYQHTDKVCQTCPLQGSCSAQWFASLQTIAARLNDTTHTDSKLFVDKNLDEILDSLNAEETTTSAAQDEAEVPGLEMKVQVDSKCFICRGTLVKGTTAIHVPNQGLRHVNCP